MNNSRATEYAQSLFIASFKANKITEVREQLTQLLTAVSKQPAFLELLNSPQVSVDEKKAWLTKTFATEIDALILTLLERLVVDDFLNGFWEVGQQFDQLVKEYLEEHFNIVEGTVHSAVPLADNQLELLESTFSKKLNQEVRLTSVVNPDLIAGYKVEIKSYLYDDTVALQIKNLRASLEQIDSEVNR